MTFSHNSFRPLQYSQALAFEDLCFFGILGFLEGSRDVRESRDTGKSIIVVVHDCASLHDMQID